MSRSRVFFNSFFDSWLNGHDMPDLSLLNSVIPENDGMFWLSINSHVPFFQVRSKRILGLSEAWNLSREYYNQAVKIAYSYNGLSLDNEDRRDILYQLGNPPEVSHPIYLVTIKNQQREQIVYIGKSSSDKSRFDGGHSAAIKLLNPIYNEYEKMVYFCQVMTYNETFEYLPLEYIGRFEVATSILNDVESMLINSIKPALNDHKKNKIKLKNSFNLLIENITDGQLLKNKSIYQSSDMKSAILH